MEIIKIAPETLEALQNAPCAQPPRPLPMAEAGTAVKDATEVWGYLSASGCSISEYVEHALLAQLGGDTDA